MTRDNANRYLAAILTTLADAKWAPEGHLYAALMGEMSLDEFQILMGIAQKGELVEVSSHVVTITSKGRELAKKIEAFAAAQ